jgi:phenylacetate-CoA ligase
MRSPDHPRSDPPRGGALDLAGRRAVAVACVLAWDRLPGSVLRRWARGQLVRSVRRSCREVPFVARAALAAGVTARRIRGVEDLARLPLTRREELRRGPREALLASGTDLARCVTVSTSGTSGDPLTVVLDRWDQVFAEAVWLRSYAHLGLRPRQRRAVLRMPDPEGGAGCGMPGLRRALRLPLPLEVSSAQPVDDQVRQLLEHRPQVLQGSPSELALVARRLHERGTILEGVELVVCGGEPLADDVRRLLGERLGAEPRRVYGTAEVGFIAWECPRGRYHYNADHVWCETIGDGLDGRSNLVITTLRRRAMPLVRFVTGDVVLPAEGPCDCGAAWPVLGEVLGPESSFLRLPGGGVVPPRSVAAALAALGGSPAYRLIQRQPAALDVLVERRALQGPQAHGRLEAALAPLLGSDLRLRVCPVDDLGWTSLDKRSLVECHLS